MKPLRPEVRKGSARHSEAMILFGVGEGTFAIAANAVEEIRNSDALRPFLRGPVAKVRHLVERAGKTYFVVDACCHFRMLPRPATRVLILRRGHLALLVERIDLMKEVSSMHALPPAFHGEERHWFRGLAALPGAGDEVEVVPVINPETLLSESEFTALAALLKGRGVTA